MLYYIKCRYAPLAQLEEQLTLNQWVAGSIPVWCTIYFQESPFTGSFLFTKSSEKNIVLAKIVM